MVRIKIFWILPILFSFNVLVSAQELNCRVSVSSQQVQGTNKEIYNAMQKAIFEFMNNRKWTEHLYSEEELIECSIVINITEQISSDEFRGTIQVQSRRPVFNANYKTNMINHRDNDVQFKFAEFEPLLYKEDQHTSNLVALLSFYGNLILAMDYDSFSPEGGSLFFQRMQTIVNNAQSTNEPGWKAFEGMRNRYWIADNYNDPKYEALRSCNYAYHRLGLDMMIDDVNEARNNIAESLQALKTVYQANPNSFIMSMFFNSKADEITKIFKAAFPDEKTKVVNLLKEIDPSNISKWESITK